MRKRVRFIQLTIVTIGTTILLLLLLLPITNQDRLNADTAKQNGISYDGLQVGAYNKKDSKQALENLAATGADWVSIIVIQYQTTTDTTIITRTAKTLPDAELIEVINQAQQLDLKVMLKPHVDVLGGTWRGEIGENFTESEWQDWFSAYRQFITHYAQLAADQQVEQFALGTELRATSGRTADWITVVNEVKQVFSGTLTYAANWDEAPNIAWWDEVTYIGVDAYYPLADNNAPTLAELKAGWQKPITELDMLSTQYGMKPIIFTEIGYQSNDGTASHPYDFLCGSEDQAEQNLAYQAAFDMVYDKSWFKGFYWYTWTPDPLDGGPYDSDYTPHAKLAENTLREKYGGAPGGTPSPPLHPPPDETQALIVYDDDLAEDWFDDSHYWGATADLANSEQVAVGSQAITVTINRDWGGLALGKNTPLDISPYYWLEFYIRGEVSDQAHLWAFFYDANGIELRKRPVDDRYIDNGTIDTTWKRVRVPLSDLNAANKQVNSIVLQDRCGQSPISFQVDHIRLLGAGELEMLFLPLLLK